MNSLGWSRRDPAMPATTSNASTPFLGKLQSLNPFGQGGYVRLPLYENEAPGAPLPARTRREEEEGWFARTSHGSFPDIIIINQTIIDIV